MDIKEARENTKAQLDVFIRVASTPELQGFGGVKEMLEYYTYIDSILQQIEEGLLIPIPCLPDEFWIENESKKMVRVVRIKTDHYGVFVVWRYKGYTALHECNPTYFKENFRR